MSLYNRKRVKGIHLISGESFVYESAAEAGRTIGITSANILSCCIGRKSYHTAGGYMWEFVKETPEEPARTARTARTLYTDCMPWPLVFKYLGYDKKYPHLIFDNWKKSSQKFVEWEKSCIFVVRNRCKSIITNRILRTLTALPLFHNLLMQLCLFRKQDRATPSFTNF